MIKLSVGEPIPNIQYYKDMPDPVLQADSFYPAWVFDIALSPPEPLIMLRPEEIKTKLQLRRLNQFQMRRNNIEAGLKKI